MTSFLDTREGPRIDVRGSRVHCAIAIPGSETFVAATNANELVYGEEVHMMLDSPAKALACVRYAAYSSLTLPDEHAVVLVLSEDAMMGLRLYMLPKLERVEGKLAEELVDMTRKTHIFSVDSLGSDLVGDSFRVATAYAETVRLLDINPSRAKVTVLGEYTLAEQIVAVAFSEMTIVTSTAKVHHMLRISRGGGLAVAATVNRTENQQRRPPGTTAVKAAVDGGSAAVLSFIGGLFGKWDTAANIAHTVALALPDNRWLLVVDRELVTYSSFGAKLEEMENAFKSKNGMDTTDTESVGRSSIADAASGSKKRASVRHGSGSSIASFATDVTHKTFLDEAMFKRSQKPPLQTVFSSPFVLSITEKNEVLAFASNGSIPGVLEQLDLSGEGVKPENGVKILKCRNGRTLAAAYWPSGRVIIIELRNNLELLIEEKETQNELSLALALVPADQTGRMITLRRLLAAEARSQEWHDAAIHHMQNVINLSMRGEGVDQVDLVAEAVHLRGARESRWQADDVTATMWADFLFRLRRRVMRPSKADVEVLETICRADVSATRVKALLSVKHSVSLKAGEDLITSEESSLRREERIEALVTLYTSLGEHGKALVLLENADVTNSFDGVAGYLSKTMKASDDEAVFFEHLKWLAQRSQDEAQGRQKLENVILEVVHDSKDADTVLGQVFTVLIEEAEDLITVVIDDICPPPVEEEITKQGEEKEDFPSEIVSGDVLASALLAGMAKADALGKQTLFAKLRSIFGSRILHRTDASYHSYTLLQALQKPENKALGLHEELAFLLGRQGRHEAAADELAAEHNLAAEEALTRLTRMLPASEKPAAAEMLVAAYLRVSAQRLAMRTEDAGTLVRRDGGSLDIERLLLEGRCSDESLTLSEMHPFLQAALIAGGERVRIAEMLQAIRKSEVRRLREEVLSRRRRFVVIGHERACILCTRRVGDAAFAAYPDGSVAHLACHVKQR